jgi:hypothetical protein
LIRTPDRYSGFKTMHVPAGLREHFIVYGGFKRLI